MKVVVTGSSDDLIELDGDLSGEIYAREEGDYLTFPDGTVLYIVYGAGDTPTWNIDRVKEGAAKFERIPVEYDEENDREYTDIVTLTGDNLGSFKVSARKPK